MTPRSHDPVRSEFESDLGFEPDPFQAEAFDVVDAGHSVLVAVPTGAGKTVVAEYAVARALARGEKAFYTTPIKALSNQKFGDFVRAYGAHRVGLLTGDNAINGDAPIVVMTTEVLRNMIYEASPALDRLGIVVLDEVHYLQDPYRGAVWEEVIIHLDPEVRLVCLSATVSNAEEFGDWIRTVRGGTEVVIDERRPVELHHLYGVSTRHDHRVMLFPTFVEDRQGQRLPNPEASQFDPTGPPRRRGPGPDRGRRRSPAVPPDRVDVIDELERREMLPAIVFVFSRAGCDEAVRKCLAAHVRLTREEESRAIHSIAEHHCEGLSDADLEILGFSGWLAGMEAGVAAHHAGMVPPMKEAVEEAFAAGLVKVVFATETLALGVNMPARSVVIERLTKFTGERHEMLTPGEYTQLTGRAGRRGIDDVGYGIVLWNRFATFDQVASLASRRTYELSSSFRPTYNMAVNLVRRYHREEAHRLLNLSFAQYRIDREVVTQERRAEDLAERIGALEAEATCDRGDVVEYRDLRSRLDEARRQAGERDRVAGELARLRPGDVVHAGGRVGAVVVLRRGSGRGGTPSVTALSTAGKTVRLSPASFRRPPERLARITLPEPYRPKSPDYRRTVAQRLRKAAAGARGPRKGSDGDHRVEALERRVKRHPVVGCPDLTRHLTALQRAERARRDLRRLERRSTHRTQTLAAHFDRVLDLLSGRAYVEDWTLSAPGEMLSRLYSESDLLVAESIRNGLLDGLDAPSFAAVVSVFTYEFRGPVPPSPRWPTPEIARRARRIEEVWRGLTAEESALGLPETRAPDGGFADLAYEWASGHSLDDVIGDDELTGGDFVRTVKQLIDLLRQIGDAVADPALARTARSAADRLFRGVVEASARVSV